MADVKWIKITTDIFDDDKILLIESLPEKDSLIVVWFKLLCMAGKQNNSGVFTLNDRIAYTDEMLATIFRRPINTVRLALQTFEQFGMIDIIDGVITIPNWEKHQSIDKLDKIKEQTRTRVAKHRDKQKKLALGNTTVCQYCGNVATGVDHIIPIARGGKDIESNTVPCCINCNRKKNDKPLVDFLNSNRDIIRDDIVTSNEKLAQFVTLCNVTDRYIVTQCNATDKIRVDKIRKDKSREEVDVVNGGETPPDYTDTDSKLEYFKGKVMLSENQIADLLDKMGLEAFDEYVDRLNNWLNKPDVYVKSHYETILKWYNEDRNT